MLSLDYFLSRLVFPHIIRIEWLMLLAALSLFMVLPLRPRWLRGSKEIFRSVAAHRWLSLLVPVATVLIGRALLLPMLGVPVPAGADEFGYLLTADTFAHGHITNPASPVWQSFETTNVLHRPTYQSHFPVASPLLLAAAQKLFDCPWLAVYLVTALLAGCVTWMLQGWVPPKWALLGGMLVALRFGLFSFWMNSYWGGSLVALGSCLLLGIAPKMLPGEGRRNVGRPRRLTQSFLLLAVGLLILANTRPFDGAVYALPIVIWITYSISKTGFPLRRAMLAALPAVALFLAAETCVGYYQYRVTGSPLRFPYTVTAQQYGVAPPFLFQDLRPVPHYNHWEFHYFHYFFEPGIYRQQRAALKYSLPFYGRTLLFRTDLYWHFYIAPLMSLPLLFSLPSLFSRRLRLAWIILGVQTAALLIESFIQVNYVAPLTGVIVLLLITGARRMAGVRVGSIPAGLRAIRAIPVVCLVMLFLRVGFFNEKTYQLNEATVFPAELTWAYSSPRNYHREDLESFLKTQPGKQLVIVHVQHRHWNYLEDKVYNGADLENAPILWARNMDTANNCRLAGHYEGRTFWMIDDWSADHEDWRSDLKPRQVTAEELCGYAWKQDPATKDEVWLPMEAAPGPIPASLVNAKQTEATP